MSVEIIGTQSLVDAPGPKCRLCDNPPHISFNWKYAEQHVESDLHALFDAIEPVRNLKFGSLHICRLCGLNWVLDGQGRMMTRVPNDRRDLLEEWDANRLPIDPAFLKTLEGIGGIALDLWPGRDRLIVVPCAVVMRSGERIDPAVIWITTRPPIDNFGSRPRLFRDVCRVEASRFALPPDVRRATASAPEVRMGFAPTRVVATDGTPFLLHWATSVFDRNGIAGSEIRLSRKRLDPDEKTAVAKADSELATYFFADWFEGAEDLDKIERGRGRLSWIRGLWRRDFGAMV